MMDQVAVTVVGDMEQVESVAMCVQPERIAKKSIKDPIGVVCRSRRDATWQASEDGNERGSHEGRLNRGCVVAAEMSVQHLSNEVHARPPLFGKVGEYCDPQGTHLFFCFCPEAGDQR